MRRFALFVSIFALMSGTASAASLSERNFTFVPAGSSASGSTSSSLEPLPTAQVNTLPQPTSLQPGAYNDRSGMGQDFGMAPEATPQPATYQDSYQTTGGNVASPPSSMMPQGSQGSGSNPAAPPAAGAPGTLGTLSTPNALPALPPQTRVTRYDAPSRAAYNPTFLADGQSFHGMTSMPQQANFYTVVARSEGDFIDLWQQHIGTTPPTGILGPGQAAVFATTGPKSFTGYDVALRLFGENQAKVQVLATEIAPSPTVAMSRGDVSPWQVLIVNAGTRPIEVLQRRAMAGSTLN